MNADFLKNPSVGDRLISIHGRQAYEVIHVSAHNVAYRWWSLDGKSSAKAGCSRTQWEACPFSLWPSDKPWPEEAKQPEEKKPVQHVQDTKNPKVGDRLFSREGNAFLVTAVTKNGVEFEEWINGIFNGGHGCTPDEWRACSLLPWPSDKPWPGDAIVTPKLEGDVPLHVRKLDNGDTFYTCSMTGVGSTITDTDRLIGLFNNYLCTSHKHYVPDFSPKPEPNREVKNGLFPGQLLTEETAKLLVTGDVLILTGTKLGEFTLKEKLNDNGGGVWRSLSESGANWTIGVVTKYTFVRHGAAPLRPESKIGNKIANIRLQTEKRVNGSVHYKCPLSGSETVGWDEEGVVSYFNNTLCSGHTHFVPDMAAKPDEVKIIPDTLVPGQRISEKAWELLRPGDVIAYTGFKERVKQTVEEISLTSGIVIFDDGRVLFQTHARQYEFVRHAEKSTPVHVPCCTCMSLTCVTCGPKMQKEEEAYCVQLTRDLVKQLSKEKPLPTMPIYSPNHIVGGLFGLYRNGRRR